MNDLDDIATRYQVYLERLKAADYRTFNQVLNQLVDVVQKELGARELSEMSRARIEQMIVRIVNEQTDNIRAAVQTLMAGLKDISVYSYEFEAGSIMTATTVRGIAEEVQRTRIWEAVRTQPLAMKGELLEDMLSELTDTQITATKNLVRRAHAEGWTTRQALQVFRGTRKNRYSDGIVNKVARSNETVIRTAIQHAASTARLQVWKDNPEIIKEYRIVATLDSRTTPQCRALDGQKFQVGKGPVPPLHRGCRSTTVAVVDSKYDFLDEGATRASATGPVSQDLTYYAWLRTQSATFQDSVIGKARGRLLRNGGLTIEEFTRLQLNRTFEPLTLDEMRKLKPLAFQRAGI